MGLTADQFARVVGRGLLREKVQEHLAGLVPTTGLVIRVELIKTETEEQATAAQARIEGGEEFAVVARDVSTDTLSAEDGGDLGWLAATQLQTRYGQEVEDAAFGAAVGELVQVEGNGSFYLLRVVERDENGPLPEAVLGPKQSSALSDWLAARKADPEVTIERFLDQIDVPPDPFAGATAF
jgi:parvulin-like peptidyl-prolyl isomerase